MNLVLDDVRMPSQIGMEDSNCLVARTVDDAIKKMYENVFDVISIDHDLGVNSVGYEKTGIDFLNYIEEKIMSGEWPVEMKLPKLRIHSMNIAMRPQMLLIVDRINNAFDMYLAKKQSREKDNPIKKEDE